MPHLRIWLIGCVLFFGAAVASAAEKVQVVFELENTLIKRLRPWELSAMPASSPTVKVGSNVYLIKPGTREVLSRLAADPNVELSFTSNLGQVESNQILSAVRLPDGRAISNVARSVLDSAKNPGQQVDLSGISTDLSRVVLVHSNSDSVTPSQRNLVLRAPKEKDSFPDFATANAYFKGLSAPMAQHTKDSYPQTQAEWEENDGKVFGLYTALRDGYLTFQKSGKTLAEAARDAQSSRAALDLISRGKSSLNNPAETFSLKLTVKWLPSGLSENAACQVMIESTGEVIRQMPIGQCVSSLNASFQRRGASGGAAGVCVVKDTATGKELLKVQMTYCMSEAEIATTRLREQLVSACNQVQSCYSTLNAAQKSLMADSLSILLNSLGDVSNKSDFTESARKDLEGAIALLQAQLGRCEDIRFDERMAASMRAEYAVYLSEKEAVGSLALSKAKAILGAPFEGDEQSARKLKDRVGEAYRSCAKDAFLSNGMSVDLLKQKCRNFAIASTVEVAAEIKAGSELQLSALPAELQKDVGQNIKQETVTCRYLPPEAQSKKLSEAGIFKADLPALLVESRLESCLETVGQAVEWNKRAVNASRQISTTSGAPISNNQLKSAREAVIREQLRCRERENDDRCRALPLEELADRLLVRDAAVAVSALPEYFGGTSARIDQIAEKIAAEGGGACLREVRKGAKPYEDCRSWIQKRTLAEVDAYKNRERRESREAINALKSDLIPRTQTLTRDISVFHWHDREDFAKDGVASDRNPDLRSQGLEAYASRYGKLYKRTVGALEKTFLPSDRNVLGRGLYAAREPATTSSYGNTLLKIDIGRGQSFLDLRTLPSKDTLFASEDTLRKLRGADCALQVGTGFVDARTGKRMFQFDKKVMSEQGSCVDLFNSALEELKIGFVAYGFRSNKKEFCGPLPDNAQVAFVLFDIPMNQKTLSVFGSNPEAGLDVRSEKYRAYSELNPLFQFPGSGVKGEYSNDPKGSWGTRIFGCDGSYAEDVVK